MSTFTPAAPAPSGTGATTASPTDAPSGELPRIEDPSEVSPADARKLSKLFFDRLRLLEEGTREYQYVRNTLIEMNQSLVKFAARRFRNLGSGEMEDVLQVGTIGLIKAIDRFDLSREVEFSSFAVPYIHGEIKRFFRDTTWAVHVPRRLQELRTDLVKAQDALTDELGRKPTVAELAGHLGLTEAEVIDGRVAANGYTAGSLDLPADGGDDGPSGTGGRAFADTLGACDPAMELVEDFHALAPLLERLDERDRGVVEMRFGREMTQSEIGAELGVSQMHVSRMLSRILTSLRAGMLTEE